MACPETSTQAVAQAAVTYCADRGDCMFVGHAPQAGNNPTTAVAAAKAYGQSLQGGSNVASYGAIYFPFIQVIDPLGGYKWIPPTGHVLGVCYGSAPRLRARNPGNKPRPAAPRTS